MVVGFFFAFFLIHGSGSSPNVGAVGVSVIDGEPPLSVVDDLKKVKVSVGF